MPTRCLIAFLVILACGDSAEKEEGQIGERLEDTTALLSRRGIRTAEIHRFDSHTREIIHFDLNQMSVKGRIAVLHPEREHSLLSPNNSDAVIDLTAQHLVIYGPTGVLAENPLAFQGTPVSAAFDENSGYLIIYDDLQSVGILQLDGQGHILRQALLGPVLDNARILAGDIIDGGRLILSLQDETVAVVDLDATLQQGSWQFTTFAGGIGKIHWIAPIRDQNLVLARSETTIAVLDISSQSIVEQLVYTAEEDKRSIVFSGKSLMPHIFLKTSQGGSQILIPSLQGKLLVSDLGTLSGTVQRSYYDPDAQMSYVLYADETGQETFQVLRTSDQLVVSVMSLTQDATHLVGAGFVLSDMNTPLGKIQKRQSDGKITELSGYNLGYFQNR